MKKILSIILLSAAILSITGCEQYLDVNKNVDAPDYVNEGLYLPGILSAFQGNYFDIRALAPLTQMMATSSYTNFANNYYTEASDAGGELWRITYWLHGMNLENMINQSIENESWTLAGMGYAIKAFSWDCLTKYHCDLPMKQAFESGRLSHEYDYQKDIMPQVREWAKLAIEYLEMEDHTDYGTYLTNGDLVYHGEKSKWIKFAHAVIVNDLAALTNKKDFASSYAEELIAHAQLALSDNSDNFTVERTGGIGKDAQFSAYNNFWGTARENLVNSYWQSDYMVQISTGTVPLYDEATGDMVDNLDDEGNVINNKFPWKLAEKQIITDTLKVRGHYDPRAIARLSTEDGKFYTDINDTAAIKRYYYRGGSRASSSGILGTAPNLYGFRTERPQIAIEGSGRWLFRDNAPYVLMTAAEIQFNLAEAYWKLGRKADAFAAWKKAVALDLEFCGSYLNPGRESDTGTVGEDGNPVYEEGGALPGGSMISTEAYNILAGEYLAGPYVNGLPESEFTLSHIMMQKYIHLWPWGALEAWTDLRKYHFDIDYDGEYPSLGNGWTETTVKPKWDTDETKVYKGFFLYPSQVEGRKVSYNIRNQGSPCYRVRPRYNSEYMWNKNSLDALKPISGLAGNYHCSIPWFAYPGEVPGSL